MSSFATLESQRVYSRGNEVHFENVEIKHAISHFAHEPSALTWSALTRWGGGGSGHRVFGATRFQGGGG